MDCHTPHQRRLDPKVLAHMACAVGLLASFGVSAADDPLQARYTFDAGWFFLSTDTRVRVDGETSGSVGTDIDFDESFGVGDVDRFRFDGMWRFAKRHGVRAMYFENNRSGSRDLSRDIIFGDTTFPIAATVSAKSELRVMQLSYEYAFHQRENYEIAASLGLHMLEAGLGLSATVDGPGVGGAVALDEAAKSKAPLPVIGLRGLWRLSDKVYATAQAQFFAADIDEYSGTLTDLKAQVVWQFTPHFGAGIGYNDFRFRFDVDNADDFSGRLRWNYGGAMLFVSAVF
jgi:hypothetical protein